ncbi:hypothetical protein AADZ86_16745 [Colwelliaceae bacterium BS250]
MYATHIKQRMNELADKLIEGTSSAAEDLEFKNLYTDYRMQQGLHSESVSSSSAV